MSVATASSWRREPMPEDFNTSWRASYGDDVAPPRLHTSGALHALVGREPVAPSDRRWHMSVSRPDRLPHWQELVDAAHALRPGVVFVVGIPPRSWWINVHPYVLHLWETRDALLVAQWRGERRGDTPT